MIALTFQGGDVGVVDLPDGKMFTAIDHHSGISLQVPLNNDACEALAAQLTGTKIEVARSMPAHLAAPNREQRRAK